MGSQGKTEVFPYSFKTVAAADIGAITYIPTGFGGGVSNLIGLEIILPKDFYSCEGLFSHLRFVDGTTNRTINKVWVADAANSPIYYRSLSVSNVATSLTNDIEIDLTGIRNPTGTNIVFFDFTTAINGTIKLFKVDMLYQVTGLR